MRSLAPVRLDLQPLLTVAPILVLALGRLAVRVVRAENRMIRDTAEAIVWGPEPGRGRACCRHQWRVTCVPPCHGCGRHD